MRHGPVAMILVAVSMISLATPARAGWVTLPNAPISPNSRHDDVYFVSPDSGWVVNGAGEIHRTTDGGQTWTHQTTVANYLRCVGFATSLKGWAGALFGTPLLYVTSDAGINWTPVTNIPAPQPTGICGLSVVNSSVVYGVGRYDGPPARLIKTTDGGATWTSRDMAPYATSLIDVHFFDELNGLAVGGTGPSLTDRHAVILSTSDGGATWQTRYNSTRPGGEWCWKISFPTRLQGFVSIERQDLLAPRYIAFTTDGGMTWGEIRFVDDYDEEGIGFVSGLVGWVGGWTGDTYETLDGGASWHLAGFGFYLNRVRFLSPSLGYGVGETVYKYTATVTGVDEEPVALAPVLAQNRPNPVGSSTRIAFRLAAEERVRVTIHDVQGRTLLTLFDGVRPAGPHEVRWDARDRDGNRVRAGVYWYRVETPTRKEARKLVVLH
jgi:photosystem II stability/assembly factor-like uncharacterized protein